MKIENSSNQMVTQLISVSRPFLLTDESLTVKPSLITKKTDENFTLKCIITKNTLKYWDALDCIQKMLQIMIIEQYMSPKINLTSKTSRKYSMLITVYLQNRRKSCHHSCGVKWQLKIWMMHYNMLHCVPS